MDSDFARSNRRFGGRRWNVVWPASFSFEGQTFSCTILDLSHTGARIEGYGPRPVGAAVALQCEHFGVLEARVKWVRNGRAGVRFERPSAEVMDILRKVVPGMGRREAPPVQPPRASFGRRRIARAA